MTLRVGLWSPSSPAVRMFPRRTARAVAAMRKLGWTVVMSPSADGQVRASAADPATLAGDLLTLVQGSADEPPVDVVLAAAGGWTAVLVLPWLDLPGLAAAGVPVVGYSDVSPLLWVLAAHGVPAVHGPMLVSEFGHAGGPFEYATTALLRALAGHGGELVAPPVTTDDDPCWDRDDERPLRTRPATSWRVLRHGQARGPLLAGCLSSVGALFGTPYAPDTDGKVLFLEDAGIGPDRFLALFAQWRQSGRLDKAAGLVIGRRARPMPAFGGYADFDDALLHVMGDISLPIVADVDFGHTEPKLSLPLETVVEVQTEPLSLRLLTRGTL